MRFCRCSCVFPFLWRNRTCFKPIYTMCIVFCRYRISSTSQHSRRSTGFLPLKAPLECPSPSCASSLVYFPSPYSNTMISLASRLTAPVKPSRSIPLPRRSATPVFGHIQFLRSIPDLRLDKLRTIYVRRRIKSIVLSEARGRKGHWPQNIKALKIHGH